jgi:HlyD family secretion protein
MLRQVRGPGTLVPEDIRWLTSSTDATVDRIVTLPSAAVLAPDTVILELRDQKVQQALIDAELDLKAAEADLVSLKVRLNNELLQQQSDTANIQSQYHKAKIQAEANESLLKDGLISPVTTKISQVEATELENRNNIEQEKLKIKAGSIDAQVNAESARVSQKEAMVVPVQVGQRVPAGTNLARVAVPGRLKAELHIPETQAKDIELGLHASVDTRNGEVAGRVSRIDPAAQNGTVVVDISFTEALPRGARPDLSVDGTVELERLNNVMYVGRPAFGQEQSTISLFKVTAGSCEMPDEAERVTVKLGRNSVSTVEVVEGLNVGDCVILSDMSAMDGRDRVRLR